jgi:hypothetical protein
MQMFRRSYSRVRVLVKRVHSKLIMLLARKEKERRTLAVSRLMAGQKSVVPAPSDCDPAGETSRDIVLQFSPSIFTKQTHALVEKMSSIPPISPQRVWSAAKGSISPGSFENMGQGALVPVQMGPSVPDSATSRD